MFSGTESPRERHGGRIAATLVTTLVACALALAAPAAARGAAASEPANRADDAPRIPVLITLKDQVDESRYEGRPAELIRALRTTARRTQSDVAEAVDGPVRSFWLVNAVAARVTPEELAALKADPDVEAVTHDPQVRITGSSSPGAGSWGVSAVRAPEAWSRFGLTGAGVRVGSIDTGVDAASPELAGAIVGWRDFVGGQASPYDDNGHGTHTIGTMVARNVTGAPIGVAPGAQVVVAKAIGGDGTASGATLLAAAEWMTDPDGNPATADFPSVINNSWTAAGTYNEWFRPMVQRWNAMGIVAVFGAGNAPGQVGNPASYPESITVGALQESGAVSANSSRGIVSWNVGGVATQMVKPDITAPGEFIVSTLGSGYGSYSGTSMAAPHVAGTVALMKQARPDLGPDAIRDILRATATDRGAPGPDVDYGAGALDAAAAVAATGASAAVAPSIPAAAPAPRKAKVRVLRVVRRGKMLLVQGRVSGPARVRAHVRRIGRASLNVRARTTSAIRVRGGKFTLRVPTRGLARGRYVLVVVASNSGGKRLGATSRALRLR